MIKSRDQLYSYARIYLESQRNTNTHPQTSLVAYKDRDMGIKLCHLMSAIWVGVFVKKKKKYPADVRRQSDVHLI